MDIHYFQRYHQKENVATANAMLLLSRLYSYSPKKFYKFMQTTFFPDGFCPEICIRIQEKNDKSVPDATISQESFKIVIETKMRDCFDPIQLKNHLSSFKDEKIKVLLSIASEPMAKEKKKAFDDDLKVYNANNNTNIIHINLTFESLVDSIREVIDERDYEMQDVIDDFLQYCYHDNLIVGDDSWKYMRMP